MMKTRNLILSAAALIALSVPAAFAQQPSNSTTTDPNHPESIAQRKDNQQDRIAQGVRSGQLTAGETSRLENREQGINREARADRQANGGRLTRADRRAINQSQNRTSRAIYRDKHNGRVR